MAKRLVPLALLVALGAAANPIDLTEPLALWSEMGETGTCADPARLADRQRALAAEALYHLDAPDLSRRSSTWPARAPRSAAPVAGIEGIRVVIGDLDRHDDQGRVPTDAFSAFWSFAPSPMAQIAARPPAVDEVGFLVACDDGLAASIAFTSDGRFCYRDDAWLLHADAIVFSWPALRAELRDLAQHPDPDQAAHPHDGGKVLGNPLVR